ncbi:predicted protein [Uncinocarpus reesii 1704]|uniref:Uncharacterized protein n=1 Tax=Uncinocarpus reesii (strain UAMH 1704) TaxID=336963 RepID=C4JVX3_UNCRE|nr:uncharacterized protein UREG_06715 [Uncinocarpus reesii 1704]EEP81850.1 predicted protein [Uncinocarpus reesii 1704]
MEATAVETPFQLQPVNHVSNTMDTSMDIDMDLDFGPEPEPIELEVESTTANNGSFEDSNLLISNEEPQFEKVHIRGVDELATDDIKRFASEHFQIEEPARIEWIDDTSANIVYNSPEVGLQALAAFTQQSMEESGDSALPSLRLRTAKALSTHPDSVLQVRSAVKTDRKKTSEHRRRKGLDDKFDETMYDDSRDASRGSSRDGMRGRRKGVDDLFPEHSEKSTGRLRDRSASPIRNAFENGSRTGDGGRESSRRFRDRSPRQSRDRNGYSRLNAGKELFGSTNASSDESSGRRELFPNKTAASYLKKELFPNKTAISNHRRSDAFDAADETADLFAKRISIPLVDGSHDNGDGEKDNSTVELFPDTKPNKGLKIRGTSDDPGLSIRGNAANANSGIAIKGTASVRELFPSKYSGNAGKELFSDKLEGRGGKRRKAEDMFL